MKRALPALLVPLLALGACSRPAEERANPDRGAGDVVAETPDATPATTPTPAHADHEHASSAADPASHGEHAAHTAVAPARAPVAGREGHDPHAAHGAAATPATSRGTQAAAAPSPAAHAAHAEHAAHDAHADHQMPELPATAGPGYTVADVHFMQMMMGHHFQALVMAAKVPTHGADEMVLRLAEKIDISQRDEIEMMAQWLREREQAVPTEAQMLAMHMPGMLTPEQMRELDGVRGRAFDNLFLTLMIQHHEGAILMVDELFASPGAGQDSDIFRFATDVSADQGDEIFVMYRLLQMLADAGGDGS